MFRRRGRLPHEDRVAIEVGHALILSVVAAEAVRLLCHPDSGLLMLAGLRA